MSKRGGPAPSSSAKRAKAAAAPPSPSSTAAAAASASTSAAASATAVATASVTSAYDGIDGYAIASANRKELRAEGRYAETESLQYGEINVDAFAGLLASCVERVMGSAVRRAGVTGAGVTGQEQTQGKGSEGKGGSKGAAAATAEGAGTGAGMDAGRRVFLDIGSGTGKAVMVAARNRFFDEARGIELVEGLHEAAEKALVRAEEEDEAQASGVEGGESGEGGDTSLRDRVRLVCSDCLVQDWSDATVLFAPCTCFTEDMRKEVDRKIQAELRPGTLVISTTKGFTGAGRLRVVDKQRLRYAKGALLFIVHEVVGERGGKGRGGDGDGGAS